LPSVAEQSARSSILPGGNHPILARAPAPRSGTGWGGRLFLWILLGIPLAASLYWLHYYLAPPSIRVREPLHALLRPSGNVGQGFGVAGLFLFLSMWLYPLRKRLGVKKLLGSVASWLRVHTYVGLALPLLIAVHAGWRFHGLIGLGYLAMVTVSLSGIVGRYIYTRIPRSRSGLELTRDEIASRRRTLVTDIAAALGLDPLSVEEALEQAVTPPHATGMWSTIRSLIGSDFARWRAIGSLRRYWSRPRPGRRPVDRKTLDSAVRLARDEIRLNQQLRLLTGTQRVFRFWHVAHRPVSFTALTAIVVHVAVAIATGQTWLR
jgi:hypothetical protein